MQYWSNTKKTEPWRQENLMKSDRGDEMNSAWWRYPQGKEPVDEGEASR